MTIDCLVSVLASDYPRDLLDVVLVDNGSLDDVVERVRDELPMVRVIEPLANTGFAGGCNLGFSADGAFDLVALVNNDATVDPGWLQPLVDTLVADGRLGAASPKMLFAGRFQNVAIDVVDAGPIGGDDRELGIRISGVRVDGVRSDDLLACDEGFHVPEAAAVEHGEEIALWSKSRAALRLAADDQAAHHMVSLRVSSPEARAARLTSGTHEAEVAVGPEPTWVDLVLDPAVFDVINNVGSALYPNGFGGDRGFLERDSGQYGQPADVFAWCGGAVLLRREYLDEVGLFDEDFFLYYEDTDLSWRGRLAGWDYRYVPESIVRHRHAQSSKVGSPTFRFYTERNRMLVLLKNAPLPMSIRAVLGAGRRLVSRSVRDLLLRPLTFRMPTRAESVHQWRVLKSVAMLCIPMVRRRRAQQLARTRMSILDWEMIK